MPVPGRAEWYDWSGPVPYEDLPRASLATPGRLHVEALFEGRLVVVARFTARGSAGPP